MDAPLPFWDQDPAGVHGPRRSTGRGSRRRADPKAAADGNSMRNKSANAVE